MATGFNRLQSALWKGHKRHLNSRSLCRQRKVILLVDDLRQRQKRRVNGGQNMAVINVFHRLLMSRTTCSHFASGVARW